jgi:DNA-binding beta-propeller fold protein YncE
MLRRVSNTVVLLAVLSACSVLSNAPSAPTDLPTPIASLRTAIATDTPAAPFAIPTPVATLSTATPIDTPAPLLTTPTAEPTPTPAPDLPAIWVLDSSGNRWLAVDPQTGKTLNEVSRMLGLTTSHDGRWRYVLQAQLQDGVWRADVLVLDLTRSASVRRISVSNGVPDSTQVNRTISTSGGVILSRDERRLYATTAEFTGAQWVTRLYVIDLSSQKVARSFDVFSNPAAPEAPSTRPMLSGDQRRLLMMQSAQRQPPASPEAQANWFTRIAVLNLQDGNVERALEVPGDIQAHGIFLDAVLSPDGQWLYLMQVFTRSAEYAGYRFVTIDLDRNVIGRTQTVEKANGGEEFSYFQAGLALTLTPDGRYLVGYTDDTRNITHEYFQFLDTQTGLVTQKVPLERSTKPGSFDLSELLLSPDKRLVYVAFATSKEVFTLDLAQRQIVRSAILQDPKSAAPSALDRLVGAVANWFVSTASAKMSPWPGAVLSPDGQRIYFVGIKDFENGDGVWAVETATLRTIGHWLKEKDFDGIRLSADGSELYAASPNDNTLYVLDALTGEARRTLKLAFRPDGFVTSQTY